MILFFVIPPSATMSPGKNLEKILNLIIFKNFFDFFILNRGDKKITCTPCFFFSLISFKLCAEPRIGIFLFCNFLTDMSLLNDGI